MVIGGSSLRRVPRTKVHDAALRSRLLECAGATLSAGGLAALSLRSLAAEVGTSTTAVYALFGVVLIPVSILAIRLSERFIHPVAFDRGGPNMAASQFFTFCVGCAAMLALAAALYNVELAGKRLDARLKELREVLT